MFVNIHRRFRLANSMDLLNWHTYLDYVLDHYGLDYYSTYDYTYMFTVADHNKFLIFQLTQPEYIHSIEV